MIVVTIDLWRRGNPKDQVRLGTIHITNTGGTRADRKGNYVGEFWGKRSLRRLARRDVVLSGFPRLRLTVFHLLKRVLEQAGY